MKHVLIFALSLICWDLYAQSEPEIQLRRVSHGLYLSPTLNYRTLTSKASTDLVKTIRDEEEVAGFGYRAGWTMDYLLSEKIGLQSGLILSNRVFRTSKENLAWSDPGINDVTEAYISQQYVYLDIPLKVKYNLSPQKKLNYFVAGGLTTSLFFWYSRRNHVKVADEWEVSKKQSFLSNSLNLFAEFESGVEYRLSPRLNLRTALNFQHALLPTNSNLKTKEYLYSAGWSVGLVFTPYKKVKR